MLHPEFDGYFYHATSVKKAEAILKDGLVAGSYLCIGDIADYYLETVEDEGDTPVLLKIDASDLSCFAFEPDMPGIEEPISGILGLKEEEVWKRWEASDHTWQACFTLISSVKSKDAIPPGLITRDT